MTVLGKRYRLTELITEFSKKPRKKWASGLRGGLCFKH